MLKHLEIKNYALIEHLSIDFSEGFSVLTGETGSGKSIIMGALALVLGQRADSKTIQEGKQKCVVEATFEIKDYGLEHFFEANDLDFENEIIVRREVQDSGKSRAFINDTPTTLNTLKELTSQLIDIHSQHENLLLTKDSFLLDIVDSVAKNKLLKKDFFEKYTTYKKNLSEFSDLKENAEKIKADRDYAEFQFNQLLDAKLQENEQESLETELAILNHTEEIKNALSGIYDFFEGEQQNSLSKLRELENQLKRIEQYSPALMELSNRMESCRIELKDISGETENLLNTTDFNPNRKAEIEERLNTIYSLQQKHRVDSVAELLILQNKFEQKLQQIDSFDAELEMLQKKVGESFDVMQKTAELLTQKRKSVCEEISKMIEEKLLLLGMPNSQFEVSISEKNEFSPSGKDNVEFLFTANKNGKLKPITDIASGGEMSRVMLSIKSLLISKSYLPTIIFDEIDTGVSGEIAHRMGEIMASIAETTQVISITHLPQIASKGTSHFKVYKFDNELTTITNIVKLSEEERILEVAELLSGKNPSQAAIENAKELLFKA
ncbi:MAG: DNA repair protein RecN [Paludibacteraceae bacterium]|nr:DNA repair protein RecN [Paludibacteraceae bacterium]